MTLATLSGHSTHPWSIAREYNTIFSLMKYVYWRLTYPWLTFTSYIICNILNLSLLLKLTYVFVWKISKPYLRSLLQLVSKVLYILLGSVCLANLTSQLMASVRSARPKLNELKTDCVLVRTFTLSENFKNLCCTLCLHAPLPSQSTVYPIFKAEEDPCSIWRCTVCDMDVKEDKTVHNVVFHDIKTKYFRCPACNYADIRLPRFQKHLDTHNCLKVSQALVKHCLKARQPMVTAFIECLMPQCDFRTNTDDNLNDHMLFTHNIHRGHLYGWGIGEAESFCYTPVRKMPPSLHDIFKSRFCVKMIGKFYGATQAVAVFHQVVLPKTYTVTCFDSVMGVFKFTLHPSLKTYCKQKHYANDNENMPRARMEVMDATKKPWQAVLCLSTQAILKPTRYILSDVDNTGEAFGFSNISMEIIPHEY